MNETEDARGAYEACGNCGEAVMQTDTGFWVHYIGAASSLIRCDPAKSGKPYGLEAASPHSSDSGPTP